MTNIDLPPIESFKIIPKKWVNVVRADKIDGGFKRLAIDGVFTQSPADNLVFASNSHGLGPLALTLSLQHSGKHPIIFLSNKDTPSPNLQRCADLGAELDYSGTANPNESEKLRNQAVEKYGQKANHEIIPLGMDNSQVRANIIKIARSIFPCKPPNELWVTTASGLIITSMQQVTEWRDTKFHAVLVKGNHPNVGNAKIHKAEEEFEEPARIKPLYASNLHYDAKLWSVLVRDVEQHGYREGITVLNVGR